MQFSSKPLCRVVRWGARQKYSQKMRRAKQMLIRRSSMYPHNMHGNQSEEAREGLQRCLRQLEHGGVRVQTIVTDRHPAVMKFLKESRPDVVHKFDAWHMAKGVAKKIDQLAKTRTCREVGAWKKSIVNHLYWCGASSSTGSKIVAKWKSVANRVQNIHEHDGEFPN
ncbi:hypothetical protein DPX16_19547 [Anabarilius grahami]|uniref:Uncharacterized protein n=1 Tax=Anabarilius grahami TaxID=495550 RepID=A0A3N0Z8V7_ANAGA|nr:hypothetical protein DPX16_19547 [Anabarilius grahami]